jgi:hypothetical protein
VIDRANGKSTVAQETNMPATASRKIEHKPTWLDQRQKALNPNRGGRRGPTGLHPIVHWRLPVANSGAEPSKAHNSDKMSMIFV